MTYNAYMMLCRHAAACVTNGLFGRRGIGLAMFCGLVVVAEMPAATTSNGDRVRFHWDWATQAMQSVAGANAASPQHQRTGLVHDFSHRHVIFPEAVPAKLMDKVRNDPRFWHQYLARHAHRYVPFDWGYVPDPNATGSIARDWSYSLNNGNGGTIAMPAKYSFDVNATPSCTKDFVITGVNVAGSATQANVVGLTSLYNTPTGNGLCPGTAPTLMFAYNIGPGKINSYIALSLDGTKVAFNENNGASSYFHILKWASGVGNGTSAALPATPGTLNAAVDVKLPLTGGVSTAPFVDYAADVAYVTTADSVVHKFTGVFLGTPKELTTVGTGWPASPTVTGLSTPVFDSVTRHVFFVDSSTGGIDYVDDSVVPAVVQSNKFLFAPGLTVAAPVIIDSGSQKVYAFSSNTNGAAAVAAQADTNLSLASQVIVSVGAPTANLQPLMGDFNDAYYSGTSASALLYVAGNDGSANQVPALYAIGFDSQFKMNATYSNGPIALARNVAGINASPVTAFFNTTLNKQFLFVGVSGSCSTTIAGGCIRSLDVTNNAFPTPANVNNVVFAAAGGTTMISVDNTSASAGASSVYYMTLTGKTLVKATQAGLQ
jgi:hypothetical protein